MLSNTKLILKHGQWIRWLRQHKLLNKFSLQNLKSHTKGGNFLQMRSLNQIENGKADFDIDAEKIDIDEEYERMIYCNRSMRSENKEGVYASTLRIFSMMEIEDIKRDVDSYSCVIEALVKLGMISEAELKLDQAIKLKFKDLSLFLPLFKHYSNKQLADDMARLYKILEDNDINPNEEIIHSFIILFKKIRRISRAIDTFYKFREHSNGNIGSLLYNEMLPILVSLKRYEEANTLYEELKKKISLYNEYYTNESSKAIISIKAFNNDLTGVLYFIEELASHRITVKNEHFLAAMNIFCENGKMNEFYTLLDKASSNVGKFGYSITVRQIYDACMLQFRKLRNIKLAEEFLSVIRLDKFYKDDTLYVGLLSTIYLKCGYEKEARLLLDPLLPKQASKLNKGILREFFNYYGRMGDYDEAKAIVDGYKYVLDEKDYLYFKYAETCFRGNTDQSRRLFEKISNNKIRLTTLNHNELLRCYIKAKRYKDGDWAYQRIQMKVQLSMPTYENLLRIYSEVKDREGFLLSLERMSDDLDFVYTENVYNSIMISMAKNGEIGRVKDYFREKYCERIVPNDETIEILLTLFYKDVQSKDFLIDLWNFYVKKYNIELGLLQWMQFLDFSSMHDLKEIGIESLKKIAKIFRRSDCSLERNQCYEIRNSMIRLRCLHQASSTWNEFLNYTNQSSAAITIEEIHSFSALIMQTID